MDQSNFNEFDVEYQKTLFGVTNDDFIYNINEANVTENMVKESVELIWDWYKKQPHLPENALTHDSIARFFGGSAFSIEKAKTKIDSYFTMRTLAPEILANRDPCSSEMMNSFKSLNFAYVPRLTPERHRVLIMQYKDGDMENYNAAYSFKYSIMMGELRMRYEVCSGDRYIVDMAQIQFGHVLKTSPAILKKMLYILQNCFTSKIKGIHVLNCPSYATNIINIAKSAMKKKIAERVYLHDSLDDLLKYIPSKILPKEYGGTESTFDEISSQFLKAMQSDMWRQWFIDADNIKSDESKRPEQSEDKMGDLLGIMGSFRKLDID